MLTSETQQAIAETINETMPEAFVVDLTLQKGKKSVLNIKVDTDQGISLEECTRISRKVGAMLDEREDMDFPFVLEVSSPGVGFPLKLHRQYQKEVGRHLQVLTHEGETIQGKLTGVNDTNITLEPLPPRKGKGKGKSKEVLPPRTFSFEAIKEAKVIIIL